MESIPWYVQTYLPYFKHSIYQDTNIPHSSTYLDTFKHTCVTYFKHLAYQPLQHTTIPLYLIAKHIQTHLIVPNLIVNVQHSNIPTYLIVKHSYIYRYKHTYLTLNVRTHTNHTKVLNIPTYHIAKHKNTFNYPVCLRLHAVRMCSLKHTHIPRS